MYNSLITCALLLICNFALAVEVPQEPFIYRGYTFKDMMGLNSYGLNSSKNKLRPTDWQELAEIEKLFITNIQYLHDDSKLNRIPPVVHFIWIGPKPFPPESIKNIESWQNLHPDWTFKFWTDSPDRDCPAPGMMKMLVDEYDFHPVTALLPKTTNWGEKSDLMRFVILLREGGIYADHDAECLHAFDSLLKYDFFACCERPHYHQAIDSYVIPANGLFGASPGHPVLKATLRNIKKQWEHYANIFPDDAGPTPLWKVIERTFDSFAKASKEYSNTKDKLDILLPTCYFYPRKILPIETLQAFNRKKLIWSFHHYAGAWKDPGQGPIVRKIE